MSGIISKKRLTNFKEIGTGSFGTVYKADLTCRRKGPIEVAVKCLNRHSRKDVMKERDRMEGLEHRNIVKLLGITSSSDDAIPWIVMEYMPHGDLQSYIRKYPGGAMTAVGMVKLAYGVACGMAYLQHEVPFPYYPGPHGDLAARNCLVGHNWSIKIGDFGRFDSENDDQYYNGECDDDFYQPCPIRWMPRENLPRYTSDGKPRSSRKGDVWAYGVLVFEIWTRASLPYKDLDDLEAMTAIINGENPMNYRDVSARSYILDVMNDCWETEPSDRPNFKYIKQQFEENDPEMIKN